MRTRYLTPVIALVILITFAMAGYAKVDTVPSLRSRTGLRVVPADSVGWVRVNNLADLNEKVDEAIGKLSPPREDAPQGVILAAFSKLLAMSRFTSIAALEDLGLNAHSDVCVFWVDATLQKPLAAIHVRDKAKVEADLQSRGDFVDAEYQGVSYHRSDRAALVILDDVLVYARSEEDVQRCIETHLEADQSLLEAPSYTDLDAKWKSATNDLMGHIELAKVAQVYLPMLKLFSGGTQSRPGAAVVSWLLEQVESFTTSAVLDEQGAKMDFFLGLKDDSAVQSFLSGEPRSLELLRLLSKDAPVAVGLALDAKAIQHILAAILNALKEGRPDLPQATVEEAQQRFIRSVQDFMAPLGTEAAFALQVGTGVAPDAVLLYEVSDEKAARDYMAGCVTRFQEEVEAYKTMGLTDMAKTFSQVQPGPEEVHEGVQIQSIQLTKGLPLPIPDLPRSQQPTNLWYTFQSGKLLMGLSSDSMVVKQMLDVLAGKGDGLDHVRGFEKVHGELPSESNFSLYFAPISFYKWVSQVQPEAPFPPDALAKVEQGIALGISAAVQDEGIASRLYISAEEAQRFVTTMTTITQAARSGPRPDLPRAPMGRPAPPFALRDLDGKEVKLSDFKGKVVVLDFWATWCPPCAKEIPHFIELYKEYKDQGFAMVGISVDNDVEAVRSFVQRHKVNYLILMTDGEIHRAYDNVSFIPTTFVIDRAGNIRRTYVSYWDKAVFEKDIKEFLAEKSSARETTETEEGIAVIHSGESSQQILSQEESAALATKYHDSELWLRLGQSRLAVRDRETIQACMNRLRRRDEQSDEPAWYLYKYLERASGERGSRRDQLALIIADERLTEQDLRSSLLHYRWPRDIQEMATISIAPSPLLLEFAGSMSSKGLDRIPDRNASSAFFRPVLDGEIVLVRTSSAMIAVVPQHQEIRDREREGLKYSWFLYSGQTPDLSVTPDESGEGEDYGRGGAKITFKDITIDWSGNSDGKGWFYYQKPPNVELAFTGKKVLSEIDLEKDQLIFARSLRHYLSQVGLDAWIARLSAELESSAYQ